MTVPQYTGPSLINVAMLPGRCAYLVADGSENGFRAAVQKASTRWGGMTEPILTVERGGLSAWSREVIEVADVEAIVNVDAPADAAAVAATSLGLPYVSLDKIDRAGSPARFTTHPANLPRHYDPNGPGIIMAQEDSDLWQIAAAGDLKLTDRGGSPSQDGFSPYRPATSDQIARAQLYRSTLIDRTVDWFSEHRTAGLAGNHSTIVVVAGKDDFLNCLMFWNLRALRSLRIAPAPFILLPANEIESWLHFPEEFQKLLSRPAEFEPDVVIYRIDSSFELAEHVARALGLRRSTKSHATVGRASPTPPLRRPPYTFMPDIDVRDWFTFERTYGEVAPVEGHIFRGGASFVNFSAPIPFETATFCLLRFESAAFDTLPRRDEIARLLVPNATWHRDAVQVSTIAQRNYRAEFTVPEMNEVVAALLRNKTSSFKLSDKGRIGKALLARTDLRRLLSVGTYEAISELTTPRSKELLRELREGRTAGARDDDLVELASTWGGRSMPRTRDAIDLKGVVGKLGTNALEELCALGWAKRGFELHCMTCTQRSFVPLNEVRDVPTCPGCGALQSYTRKSGTTIAPSLYYRLDSLVDRASDQGVIPHLLVIAKLQQSHSYVHLIPGVELVFSGPDGAAEVDVYGVVDRKLLAGEIKTKASDFTREQIERDVALSMRLGVDIHLIGTMADLPAETQGTALGLCQDARLELLILTREELGASPGRPAAGGRTRPAAAAAPA